MSSRKIGTVGAIGINNVVKRTITYNREVKRHDALELVAVDAFMFWPLQIAEHFLIIHLGLIDGPLKDRSYAFHLEWLRLTSQGKERPSSPSRSSRSLSPSGRYAPSSYTISFHDIQWDRLQDLIQRTRAFQVQLRHLIEEAPTTQSWLGWISGAYMEHITEELDYFTKKISLQPINVDGEFLFWLDILKDHAATVAGFIDPRERNQIHIANGLADDMAAVIEEYKDLPDEITIMRQIGLEHSDRLELWYANFIGQMERGQVKSTLHPVLAAHIDRENRYGIALLAMLIQHADK
jgi:hypothetical protein